MYKKLGIFALVITSFTTMAQDFKLKVWLNGAPDSNGMTLPEEVYEGKRVRNVSEAEIYVYLPKIGINTGVNRERIKKLWQSTNIVPKRLLENGFVFQYDIVSSLNDWKYASSERDFD